MQYPQDAIDADVRVVVALHNIVGLNSGCTDLKDVACFVCNCKVPLDVR